jgi:hypothetical protein
MRLELRKSPVGGVAKESRRSPVGGVAEESRRSPVDRVAEESRIESRNISRGGVSWAESRRSC